MKFPLPHKIREGTNTDFGFVTESGVIPSIQVNVQRELTPEQVLKVLKRLKSVVSQQKLKSEDSEQTGDKYTHCNWGMCTDSPHAYPDPAMHVWPYDFVNEGRVAPLGTHILCPMDKRDSPDGQGCFHSCRVFQGPRPNQQQAIELYQIRIEENESNLHSGGSS